MVPVLDEQALAAAEAALWAWYLDWSAVARNAIHDRRLLMSLGFLRATTKRNTREAPLEDEDDLDDVVPVPV